MSAKCFQESEGKKKDGRAYFTFKARLSEKLTLTLQKSKIMALANVRKPAYTGASVTVAHV